LCEVFYNRYTEGDKQKHSDDLKFEDDEFNTVGMEKNYNGAIGLFIDVTGVEQYFKTHH
jgi:hypothetical protein